MDLDGQRVNSFLQYRTESERYENFPSWWEQARALPHSWRGDKTIQRPVMTNSEQVVAFGQKQYAKLPLVLAFLRESVMGNDLFDRAFKEYAQRWAFKHPQPADFFRTMEDASAVDLDWFWRGWYYGTDHTDMELSRSEVV